MPNGENKNGTPWWANLPKAFANLVPLSSMGMGATFGMAFAGKSLEEVVREEVTARDQEDASPYWEEEDPFGGMDGLGDPGAVDKAAYQLENPNALMTPWGPALTDSAVEMVLMANPGIAPMMGLSPEEKEAAAKDADDLIDNTGGWLDDFWDDVKENAMAMGADVLSTGRDMFDASMELLGETMGATLATQEIQSSLHPSHPDYESLMVSTDPFAVGMGAEGVEQYGATARGIAQLSVTPVPDPITEDGGDTSLASILANAFTVGGASRNPIATQMLLEMQDRSNPMNPEHDVFVLYDELNSWLGDSDEAIVREIVNGLGGIDPVFTLPELQGWMATHPEFQEDRPELFSPLTFLIDMRFGAEDSLTLPPGTDITWDFIKDYTTPEQKTPAEILLGEMKPDDGPSVADDAGQATGPTAAQLALEGEAVKSLAETEAAEAQFLPKFYQAMSKVPNGNHSAVRANMVNLYYDARVIHAIWNAPSGSQNMTPESFAEFLDRPSMMSGQPPGEDAAREGYVWNPRAHLQGQEFYANFDKIKQVLEDAYIDPEAEHLKLGANAAILAFFGGDENMANRDRLARLYSTGFDTGYISSKIHGTLRTTMVYWRNTGVEEWDIFDRITKTPYEKAIAATPYGTAGAPPSSQTTMPQQYDFIDMMDPRLTGGTRGARHFQDVEDVMFGVDPGLTTEVDPMMISKPQLDIISDKTRTDWGTIKYGELDPDSYSAALLFPELDPANLPSSNLDQAAVAAYQAAQEANMPWNTMPISKEMYGEAMAQLTGEGVKPGTTYHPYKSKVAAGGIPSAGKAEAMMVASPPFDGDQAKRLRAGLPYITGRWTGGSSYKWSTLSAADKDTIMGGDLWVKGTTQDPAMWMPKEEEEYSTAAQITPPAVVAANKAFLALSPKERALVQLSWGKAFVGEKSPEYLKAQAEAKAKKEKEEQDALIKAKTLAASSIPLWMRAQNLNQ